MDSSCLVIISYKKKISREKIYIYINIDFQFMVLLRHGGKKKKKKKNVVTQSFNTSVSVVIPIWGKKMYEENSVNQVYENSLDSLLKDHHYLQFLNIIFKISQVAALEFFSWNFFSFFLKKKKRNASIF